MNNYTPKTRPEAPKDNEDWNAFDRIRREVETLNEHGIRLLALLGQEMLYKN
jgi:hypothetical protein